MYIARTALRGAGPPLRARAAYQPIRGIASTSSLLLRRDGDEPRGSVRGNRGRYRGEGMPGQYPQFGGPFGMPGLGGMGAMPGYGSGSGVRYEPQVVVPDDPNGVLNNSHAAASILAHPSLVVVRQLEMMNVFLGYEQANKYAIYEPGGNVVGYMAEEDNSMAKMFMRQFMHTHRPFKSTVMDASGRPVLWIRRPFAFINSRIFVRSEEGEDSPIVGETKQIWHPWRRKYDLFTHEVARDGEEDVYTQFARINGGFLTWDFWLKDRHDRLMATISKNFTGFGREIFTDTGQYVIRFDAAGTELDLPPGAHAQAQGQSVILPEGDIGLTLDERAMTLATAVSIDFDYFSRHSGGGGMGLPFFIWGGGDGSSEQRGERRPEGQGPGYGDEGAAGATGAAGAAGAAGAGGFEQYPAEGSPEEDELIYGRRRPETQQDPYPGEYSGRNTQDYPEQPPQDPPVPGQQAEGFDWPGSQDYGDEPLMQDPWENQQSDDGGWFGGGGGGGGDGGGFFDGWGDN